MILLNKPKYLTSLQAIERFKILNPKYLNSKLGYAGTLDPMATGLLIVLVDKENLKRDEYIGLNKTYEFEILLGIETDTYDIFGVISSINKSDIKKLELNNMLGEYTQKFPAFSAKIINGKRLYKHSLDKTITENNLPTYKRFIYSLDIIDSTIITKKDILKHVKTATDHIKGDFRFTEINKSWSDNQDNLEQSYLLTKLRAEVSSGTYIRRLCVDLATFSNTVGLAYSINRTKVGNFELTDAIQINN